MDCKQSSKCLLFPKWAKTLKLAKWFYFYNIFKEGEIVPSVFGFRGHFRPFCGSAGFNGWVLGGWRPPGHAPEKSGPKGPRNQVKMDLAWNFGLSLLLKMANYARDGLPRSQSLQNKAWHPYHYSRTA